MDSAKRELIPHIGPIPILIPLRLFLEGIEYPRIMLSRALRGSFVEEKSLNMAGYCRMRDKNSVVYSFFNFHMNQSALRKRNGLKDSTAGASGSKAEQRTFSFIFWRRI